MSLPGLEGVEPDRGDPGAIRSLASAYTARVTALGARARAARDGATALAGAAGDAVDALCARYAAVAERFDRAGEAVGQAADVLDGYATALDDLFARTADARASAHHAYDTIWVRRGEALNAASEFVTGWALGWDDVLPSWMYLDDPGYLARWRAAIEIYRARRTDLLALQSERDDLDAETAAALRAIPLLAELSTGSTALAGALAAAQVWAGDAASLTAEGLAALEDPDTIRAVWNGLDETARAALIAASPLVIGNLDGIPIRDRVTANRLNIENEIAAREAEIERLRGLKADALGAAYHSGPAVAAQYDRLIDEQLALITSYRGLLTQNVTWHDENRVEHVDVGARVVVFDPRIDAIATYQGPIDPVTGDIPTWVRNVAVSVPGTGTTMTDFSDGRGRDLYEHSGYETAVFQWAGGTFPGSIPQATDSSFARDLAPRLRDFTAGIAVPDAASLTVLGHSYGGATVGLAEQAGLKADRILYVSAAGMGAGVDGLEDFPHTSDVPHYALMARNDLVVGLIQGDDGGDMHGQSAVTAAGVTRLETGFVVAGDPDSGSLEDWDKPGTGWFSAIDSHSTVFHPGSTSFQNIVAVITGGEAELYAPDEVVVVGGHVITIDGIDRDDYTPTHTEIP